MVTSPIAALNETAGDRAVMIDGDWISESYQDKFVKASVEALLNTTEEKRQSLTAYAKEHFDWVKVAKSWNVMFSELLSNDSSVLPYKSGK